MDHTEETTVTIPESITIGGISYVVRDTPELLKFMQAVAKVEKNKMYTQFELLRKQINQLSKTPVSTTPLDATSLIAELKESFVTKEDLANTVKEALQPVISYNQQTQQETLETFREKLLKENDGKCIPELITGNSKEELLQSLEKSKELYSKYGGGPVGHPQDASPVVDPTLARQAANLAPEDIAPRYIPPVPAPAPRVSAPEFTGQSGLENIKSLSPEEFAAKRAELENTLKQLYGN